MILAYVILLNQNKNKNCIGVSLMALSELKHRGCIELRF